MSKKHPVSRIDFDTGVFGAAPSIQEGYKQCNKCQNIILNKETRLIIDSFNKSVTQSLTSGVKSSKFPTKNDVCLFIVTYFASVEEYKSKDLDNMAKTLLDCFKGHFYHDDNQVKELLMVKKIINNRVKKTYTYIAIKELIGNTDSEIVKVAGVQRSETYYDEMEKTLRRS